MSTFLGLLQGTASIAIAPVVAATPYIPGTLQNYFDLVSGCEIAVTTFSKLVDAKCPYGAAHFGSTNQDEIRFHPRRGNRVVISQGENS